MKAEPISRTPAPPAPASRAHRPHHCLFPTSPLSLAPHPGQTPTPPTPGVRVALVPCSQDRRRKLSSNTGGNCPLPAALQTDWDGNPNCGGPRGAGVWNSVRREERREEKGAAWLSFSTSQSTLPFPAWCNVPTVSLGLSETFPVPQAPEGAD